MAEPGQGERDGGREVYFEADLVKIIEDTARTSGSTFEQVVVSALKNERLIAGQLALGRTFQVKDAKRGVADVDFV